MSETPTRAVVRIDMNLGSPDRLSPAATAGLIGQTFALTTAMGEWDKSRVGKGEVYDARTEDDGRYLVLTFDVIAGEGGPLVEEYDAEPVDAALGFKVDAAHRAEDGMRIFDQFRIFEVSPLTLGPRLDAPTAVSEEARDAERAEAEA